MAHLVGFGSLRVIEEGDKQGKPGCLEYAWKTEKRQSQGMLATSGGCERLYCGLLGEGGSVGFWNSRKID